MKIEVTQEDIKKGKKAHGCDCALAIAITRATGVKTTVAFDTAFLNVGLSSQELDLPDEACRFYHRFDKGQKVKPFSFELPLEPSSV